MNAQTKPFSLLLHYLRPHRGRVVGLTVLLLGSIGLQLLAPQIIGRFLDAAEGAVPLNRLYALALLFLVTVLVQKALGLASRYMTEDLGWRTTNALRIDLTTHILRLDMGFHKLRTPGELIDRIDTEISNLAEYFSELITQVFANGLLVLGIIVLLSWEAWPAGVIALVYAVLVLVFLRAIQNRVVGLYKQISVASADMFGFLGERLNGTEDVRGNGAEAYVMSELYPRLNRYAALRIRTYTFGAFTGSFSIFLYALALTAMLSYGAYAYLQGQMTIGTVFVLFTYVGLMTNPVNNIRRNVGDMQRALASIGRTAELFALLPEADLTYQPAALPDTPPQLRFDGVTFAYKDRLPGAAADAASEAPQPDPIVLSNITFSLAPGHVLGVLGRTGSGKTTLTRLLFRLYGLDAGAITLDGINIANMPLGDLRRRVGLVTQDVQIFGGSVRDNLLLFQHLDPAAPPITDDALMEALETLGLGDWVRGLPAGLDSVLKSGGQGLSAGEAQLLALARVFLSDPHVVVLDEASSRLDPATEQLLERAIDRLLAGRTGVVIAHRLHTVQRADDILILEDGRVVEHGLRTELAGDPQSRFYNLLQTGLEEVLA